MSLNSPLFLIAFFVFFALYWRSGGKSHQWHWLLAASLAFLLTQGPWLFADLLAAASLTYLAGRRVPPQAGRAAKPWLTLSVLLLAANLVFSKLPLGLPFLGASFFTFQLIGYLIDVSRGRLAAESDFPLFLASASSFLYISSGPILRTARFLPQLRAPAGLTYEGANDAIFRVALGFAKKVLGDRLALLVVDFSAFNHRNSVSSWVVALAITGQYYADFSGYSDIAIGLGKLLGLSLPENFHLPYLAASPAEFWRRWHITLCDWFRDYVFTPLCLARWPMFPESLLRSTLTRMLLALGVTVGLIGLWHGPTLNNLLWGLYNGLLIVLTYWAQRHWPAVTFPGKRPLQILVTFYLLLLGRLFTCTANLTDFYGLLRSLHTLPGTDAWNGYNIYLFTFLLLAIVVPHGIDYWYLSGRKAPRRDPVSFLLTSTLILLTILFGTQGRPFLYERF